MYIYNSIKHSASDNYTVSQPIKTPQRPIKSKKKEHQFVMNARGGWKFQLQFCFWKNQRAVLVFFSPTHLCHEDYIICCRVCTTYESKRFRLWIRKVNCMTLQRHIATDNGHSMSTSLDIDPPERLFNSTVKPNLPWFVHFAPSLNSIYNILTLRNNTIRNYLYMDL